AARPLVAGGAAARGRCRRCVLHDAEEYASQSARDECPASAGRRRPGRPADAQPLMGSSPSTREQDRARTSRTGIAVMLGGMDGGPLEALLRRALEASALDTLETAQAAGRFDDALLLIDRAPVLPVPPGVTVETDEDAGVSA